MGADLAGYLGGDIRGHALFFEVHGQLAHLGLGAGRDVALLLRDDGELGVPLRGRLAVLDAAERARAGDGRGDRGGE